MSNFSEFNINTEDSYYGSRMFQSVADKISLPIDQVNFLITQVFALFLAHIFRVVLHPNNATSTTRYWTAFSAGLCMSYFCFGKQVLLPVIFVVMCYCILLFLPSTIFHHITLIAAIAFLSFIHLHRLLNYGVIYSIDISAPLMIMVQKATSLAYSLHDGMLKDDSSLTSLQKKFLLRSKPSILKYFSYLLCFQSILAGPFFMFTDYQDFIEGNQYIRYEAMRKKEKLARQTNSVTSSSCNRDIIDNNNENCGISNGNGDIVPPNKEKNGVVNGHAYFIKGEPNPTGAALRKMVLSFVSALIVIFVLPYFPCKHLKDSSFLSSSFLYKIFYILIATTLARHLYYTAWYLADAVCSMSGFGFNGFDEKGNSQWDLVANVNIVGVEFGTSLKSTLDSWNIGTMKWLRFLVYERVTSNQTFFTFLLSSIWHGFYPGYYITFMGGAFFTMVARTVRRSIRPRVLTWGSNVKLYYDFLTFVFARFCLSYITFPFVLLEFWGSFYVYDSINYYFHSMGLLVIILLPLAFPPPTKFPTNSKVLGGGVWHRGNKYELTDNRH